MTYSRFHRRHHRISCNSQASPNSFVLTVGLLAQGIRRTVSDAVNQRCHALVFVLNNDRWHASQMKNTTCFRVDAAIGTVDVLDIEIHLPEAMAKTT